MVELAGLFLGILGVLFAFETPRRRIVGLFSGKSSIAQRQGIGSTIPVIDICHRGISVDEIEPNKLRFDKGGKVSYSDFTKGISSHCCSVCINHTPLRLPGDKWHAKVFIGKSQGAPIVAAIGSSNLTRRAFDTIKNFNYECDVLFWDESHRSISSRVSALLGEAPDESLSIVVAKVDQTHPVNRVPVSEKLKQLEREIRAKAVVVA